MTSDRPVLYSADFSGCTALAALHTDEIADLFASALRDAGATIVQQVSHVYPGAGLTCVLVLRESHAVLHTWPETGTVNIDIFSCSSRLRGRAAVEALRRAFAARGVDVQEMPRADGHLREPSR